MTQVEPRLPNRLAHCNRYVFRDLLAVREKVSSNMGFSPNAEHSYALHRRNCLRGMLGAREKVGSNLGLASMVEHCAM